MVSSLHLAVAVTTVFFTHSLGYAVPGRQVEVVRNDNTPLSGQLIPRQSVFVTPAHPASSTSTSTAATATTSSTAGSGLDIKIANSATNTMYAYILGQDNSNGKRVFYQNGASAWFYPSYTGPTNASSGSNAEIDTTTNNLAIEVAASSDKTITLTQYLNSGRVYIGSKPMTFSMDPSGLLVEPSFVAASDANYNFPWGIVELDWSSSELVADLSYADQVGLALGMSVTSSNGTRENPGLPAGSTEAICNGLVAQGNGWEQSCIKSSDGAFIRALAPSKFVAADSALASFYDSYIDEVWDKYTSTQLTINSQVTDKGPLINCNVSGGVLVCNQQLDGKAYTYQKPSTLDVFGCNSGPFANQGLDGANDQQMRTWPRLCAAFTRSTLLLADGDVTPGALVGADKYYTGDVTNHYARIVHETVTKGEAGSGAYAFAFDDTNPPGTAENEAGLLQISGASMMEITVRGT